MVFVVNVFKFEKLKFKFGWFVIGCGKIKWFGVFCFVNFEIVILVG